MEEIALEEKKHQQLAECIRIELESICPPPPSVINELKSVYRLPEGINMFNELYMPTLILIGPNYQLNCDLVNLEVHGCRPMEDFKKRYAKNFIERCGGISIYRFLDEISIYEGFLRDQYRIEDSSQLSSEDFLKMMLIDGCFLIEFLLRLHLRQYEEKDRMSHKKWININSDLLLLSNQIPLRLLSKLMSVGKINIVSIDKLIENFLSETLPYYAKWNFDGNLGNHLLDCLRNLMVMKQEINCLRKEKKKSGNLSLPSCPTISELHRAGVKFRRISGSRSSGCSPLDLRFRQGVLEIPPLNMDENTKKLFVNLMVLEALKGQDLYVTDYVAMMDYLIDHPEDVKILVQNGIIENFIKDDEVVSCLINELGKNIHVRHDFYYSDIVEDLNAYCKRRWINWKMDLKRDYFSNPWKALSVVAAVILLVLTIIQTVCSLFQLK